MTVAVHGAAADARLRELRRAEFSGVEPGIFLNAASFGPLPERTRAAVDALARQRQRANAFAAWDPEPDAARARSAAARLIGASPDEIALGANTSFGLHTAVQLAPAWCRRTGRDLRGSRVVVSDGEFPANVVPWRGLRNAGVTLDVVPTDSDGAPDAAALARALEQDDAAVFALSAVQFATGYRADLEAFGEICRERDILFVVDAIQAAGIAPIDVRRAHVDVLASGGQKWLCAPFGSGFAYVRRELIAELPPPVPGWLATRAAEDFTSLLDYEAPLLDDARRYETGSHAFQDVLGLATSVELILEIGVDAIRAHVASLLEPLRDWAASRPDVRSIGPGDPERRAGILCLRPPDAAAAHAALSDAGVTCALREGSLRFAPHMYNTAAEIERVVTLLDSIV